MQPNVKDLGYFKLRILLDEIIKICITKALHSQVARLDNLSLWQKLNLSQWLQLKMFTTLLLQKYLQQQKT